MTLIFVEAFGQLALFPDVRGGVSRGEDLYSVFKGRAELMGWSTTTRDTPLYWGMNDAELTAGTDTSRIGWVQVGPESYEVDPIGGSQLARPPREPFVGVRYAPLGGDWRSVEPASLLLPLIQCLADALGRFGVVALTGFQVTAGYIYPRATTSEIRLQSGLNWFNASPEPPSHALIAFDQDFLGGRSEAELERSLRSWNSQAFKFGPLLAVPDAHAIKAGAETPILSITPARSGLGVSVTLPEWTASAAGWALAAVIDAAQDIAPEVRHFTVRVSRLS